MMDVRPIRSEDDLTWALREIQPYFERPPAAGTPDAARFDVLATLIAAYESERHPVDAAGPVDVLRYAIEDLGRSQAELGTLLGSRSRASEVMAGKRPLTLDMIHRIAGAWALPVATLVGRTESWRETA